MDLTFNVYLQEVKKAVRKYTSQFELQDKMRLSKASREIIEKRQKAMASFMDYRKSMVEKFQSEKEARLRLRNGKFWPIFHSFHSIDLCFSLFLGQDTDTLTSNVNDYDEEVVEFLVKKEIIPVD